MRFITEFELDSNELKFADNPVKEHRKSCAEDKLGNMIAESFGWIEKIFATFRGPSGERYTLEIEAFPMDKWIEFKNKLIEHIGANPGDQIGALQLIKDLEFGK